LLKNPLLQKKETMSLSRSSPFLLISLLALAILSACGSSTDQQKTEAVKADSSEAETDQKTILFFGNSLTAAYGIDQEDGFAGLTQARIDSLGLNYRVINGGLSGETTAGGLSRLDWFLEDEPYLFILELGGNDGLRGILPAESKRNLIGIIDKVRAKYPEAKIILAGMQIPPNMGQEYTEEFKSIYPEVAVEKDVTLIPFLLENVGGIPELNLPDGIHPTEEGHKIVLETIWPYIENLI
jgi:acyl-CoA thioesterase-1